jgi:hypothetical protein
MNEDLVTRIIDRFSITELVEVVGITPRMFIDAFEDEILDNLTALADIDQGFVIEDDVDEDE